jgi:hypothetical protein
MQHNIRHDSLVVREAWSTNDLRLTMLSTMSINTDECTQIIESYLDRIERNALPQLIYLRSVA